MQAIIIDRVSQVAAVSEAGKVAEYSVYLSSPPASVDPVTIRFTSSDLTEGRVQNPVLTFDQSNWDQPQSLFIQGVDDYDDDGSTAFNVTGRIETLDLTYNRVSVPAISLVNLDDGWDVKLNLKGTDDVNYLVGRNGDDRIYGYGDQDDLKGGRGNDTLNGGEDDDRLYGQLGNDKLYGGADQDLLDGAEGDDRLFGEQGLDTLLGGAGNDWLDGGVEEDSMIGGAGNDTYYVDLQSDVISEAADASGGVSDTVVVQQYIFAYNLPAGIENAAIAGFGETSLVGNAANNGLKGNDSKNVLDGGAGSDDLAGGGGNDSLLGGAGNDEIAGGAGNDTIRGGAGVDCADFAAAGGALTINLQVGKATGEGSDLLFDIENICSGKGDDVLTGSAGTNEIEGGAGSDNINAGAGNDTLTGCADTANGGRGEKDKLSGGAGADVFALGWEGGVYYNDASLTSTGTSDYALITDFTVGVDSLVLDGAASNYYVGASVAGVTGYGIYLEQGKTDELVAVIQSTTTITVSNTIKVARFV